jgi:hypothetical protein
MRQLKKLLLEKYWCLFVNRQITCIKYYNIMDSNECEICQVTTQLHCLNSVSNIRPTACPTWNGSYFHRSVDNLPFLIPANTSYPLLAKSSKVISTPQAGFVHELQAKHLKEEGAPARKALEWKPRLSSAWNPTTIMLEHVLKGMTYQANGTVKTHHQHHT